MPENIFVLTLLFSDSLAGYRLLDWEAINYFPLSCGTSVSNTYLFYSLILSKWVCWKKPCLTANPSNIVFQYLLKSLIHCCLSSHSLCPCGLIYFYSLLPVSQIFGGKGNKYVSQCAIFNWIFHSDWKQSKLIILQFWRWKVQSHLAGLKSRCSF